MKFAVGIIVVLVFSALVAPLAPGGEGLVGAERWGYVAGSAMAPLFLGAVVLLVAKLMGKARAAGAGVKLVFWTAAIVLALNFVGIAGRGALTAAARGAITDAERKGLEIGSDSIRHRHFGFALPHPGKGFQSALDMQRQVDAQFAKQPNVGAWAFQDSASGGVLLVLITKGGRVTEPMLRAFANGVRKGLAVGEGWEVLEDSVEWAGPSGEYRFLARHKAPAYLGIRCLPGRQPEAPVIACVETVSRGAEDRLQFVRTGLAVGP